MILGSTPIRVLVGEDQPLVSRGIVSTLVDAGFDVVGVAADAADLLRKARAHRPDVVITDIQMPPDHTDDGLRAAAAIRRELPDVAVLVLSQFLEDRYPLELVGDRPEGVGYLLKDRVGDVSVITDAVQRVAAGGSVLDPAVVRRMVSRQAARDPLEHFTPREREVLELMAEGRSNRAIAQALVVSVPAVERHVTSIFSKLELPPTTRGARRVLAVLQYLRR